MRKLVQAVCSFIVDRALENPQLRGRVVDAILDNQGFCNEVEQTVGRSVDEAIDAHCRDESHIPEREIEEMISNHTITADDVDGMDELVANAITQGDLDDELTSWMENFVRDRTRQLNDAQAAIDAVTTPTDAH